MPKEHESIDISTSAELLLLVEEVVTSGEPKVLRRKNKDPAILTPVKPRRRPSARARAVTSDDTLFGLVGIGASGIPGGVSEKKHEYLLKADQSTHR